MLRHNQAATCATVPRAAFRVRSDTSAHASSKARVSGRWTAPPAIGGPRAPCGARRSSTAWPAAAASQGAANSAAQRKVPSAVAAKTRPRLSCALAIRVRAEIEVRYRIDRLLAVAQLEMQLRRVDVAGPADGGDRLAAARPRRRPAPCRRLVVCVGGGQAVGMADQQHAGHSHGSRRRHRPRCRSRPPGPACPRPHEC